MAGSAAPESIRSRRRTAWAVAGVACLVIVAAASGFYAGRDTVSKPGAEDPCKAARASEAQAGAAMKAATPNSTEYAVQWRTGLNLVIQNPGCYSAQDRAGAQVLLDQAASDQLSNASRQQCKASGGSWWECG